MKTKSLTTLSLFREKNTITSVDEEKYVIQKINILIKYLIMCLIF